MCVQDFDFDFCYGCRSQATGSPRDLCHDTGLGLDEENRMDYHHGVRCGRGPELVFDPSPGCLELRYCSSHPPLDHLGVSWICLSERAKSVSGQAIPLSSLVSMVLPCGGLRLLIGELYLRSLDRERDRLSSYIRPSRSFRGWEGTGRYDGLEGPVGRYEDIV